MNRHSCIALMAAAGLILGSGVVRADEASDQMIAKAKASVAAAQTAVDEAKASIAKGQQLISEIPQGSELEGEIKQVVSVAAQNWKVALKALENAQESAAMIEAASNPDLAKDYALLTTVNAGVALSSAKVVQTGLFFVEAAAIGKTEALDVIRGALHEASVAASQVQMNNDRIKKLITEKYSKQ